jgi:hypothetical protein
MLNEATHPAKAWEIGSVWHEAFQAIPGFLRSSGQALHFAQADHNAALCCRASG